MGNVPTLKDATKGALTDIGDLCNALCLESYAPFCYTYIRVAYVRGMSPKIYSERLIYIVPSITKWAWVFRSIWFSNILRASTCGGSEKSRKGAQTRWWVSRGESKDIFTVARTLSESMLSRALSYRDKYTYNSYMYNSCCWRDPARLCCE